MTKRFLVVPFDKNLLSSLSGQSVVPRISHLDQIPNVVDCVFQAGAHLHCLWIKVLLPLSVLSFKEEWRDIPIALHAPRLGKIAQLMPQLPVLRNLNIRIYLPIQCNDNVSSIRTLSSLGIETAPIIKADSVSWDDLSDLMSYAYFAQAQHAPIAPFNYLGTRYNKHQHNDFAAVYFNDPHTYLHLNELGQVALTHDNLIRGEFISDSLQALGDVEQNPQFCQYSESWREYFLQTDGCAYCPGWRVCLGRYENSKSSNPGCETFFGELMDNVEYWQSINKDARVTWQP